MKPGPAGVAGPETPSLISPRRRAGLYVFLLLLGVVLAVQAISGAYSSEMADADEPAHFISGLMVRDYLAGGWTTPPLDFARDYYSHYPKIAIGNWPPLFYAVEGVWMLLLPANPDSLLLLMALITAALGWLVFRVLRPITGTACAALGAGLLILLPPVSTWSAMVMLEMPLALASLVAVLCWARFMVRPGLREGLAFGVAATIAVLIKWNAVFLVLVPPLAILIGRRWSLLRSRGLWLAATGAVALAGAAAWLAFDRLRSGWDDALPSLDFVIEAVRSYGRSMGRSLGVAGVILFLVGTVAMLRRGKGDAGEDRAIWSSAAALIVAVTLLHLVVPAGINIRYLIPALPAVAMFVAAGAWTASTWLGNRGLDRRRADLVIVASFAAAFALDGFRLHPKAISGYGNLAETVVGEGLPTRSLILSDAIGEGAFIAEVAIRDRARPCHIVWRGTNLLALSTWAGRQYRLRAAEDSDVLDLLERASIEYVVVDRGFGETRHQEQLERVIRGHPGRFSLLEQLPVRRRDQIFPRGLTVYRYLTPSTPPSIRQVPGYDGVTEMTTTADTEPQRCTEGIQPQG